MKSAELRRHLLDADLERLARAGGRDAETVFRSILDRLASAGSIQAFTRNQKDAIAARAVRLSRMPSPASQSARAAFAKGDWLERAAAGSSLSGSGGADRAIGSLRASVEDGQAPSAVAYDGVHVARALATAMREVGTPGVLEAHKGLRGDIAASLRQENDGARVWERALSPLLREFVWNSESAGATRKEAILEALAGAAVLTGRARQGDRQETPFQLGSAARVLLRGNHAPQRETVAAGRLADELSARNAVRLQLWENMDGEAVRLMGAAAAMTVFGKGSSRPRPRPATSMIFDPKALSEAWMERFSHLTAADAANELSRLASDPRLDAEDRAVAESAAGTAMSHHGSDRVSFAEAVGLRAPELRLGSMRQGRMFAAAPRGRYPTRLICRGKRGRLIRCRAAADASGALVGYLAFDPLSREIGGRPLFAAYGLDGKRQGYAWGDEQLHWRAGAPEQGFVSAPESIPLE